MEEAEPEAIYKKYVEQTMAEAAAETSVYSPRTNSSGGGASPGSKFGMGKLKGKMGRS